MANSGSISNGGQQWPVRFKVHAKVQDLIGRGKLAHPLPIADLKDADARKRPIVFAWVVEHTDCLRKLLVSSKVTIATSRDASLHSLHAPELHTFGPMFAV